MKPSGPLDSARGSRGSGDDRMGRAYYISSAGWRLCFFLFLAVSSCARVGDDACNWNLFSQDSVIFVRRSKRAVRRAADRDLVFLFFSFLLLSSFSLSYKYLLLCCYLPGVDFDSREKY